LKLDEHGSGLVLLYPNGIAAQFSTFMYGGEFNIVLNPIVPKEQGLVWMPLFGFRYLGIDEKFEINGFNPQGGTAIRSTTINNLFGPQAGCRFEFLTKWFTIGAEPKVMLGANLAASDLSSVDATIGNSSDHAQYTHFAPVGALDVYVKIPLQEHIRVFVTYNLLGTGFISRPQEQIDYNTSQLSDGSIVNDMHLDIHNSAFMVQGYSIGVEFNF
jgi:Putative beta barrel porin-7 (BBP7)